MNMIDIITGKKNGRCLTNEELFFSFDGYLNGNIPDYQMSSLLMAICLRGMSEEEIFDLTNLFINSGDCLDLSPVSGIKVDKHSTGGVGDKTTLVIGPIVSSLGVVVAKMSGKGLGITGGTIDKLESIPGFSTELDEEKFLSILSSNNFAVTSQTKNLVPMDKVIYALRDITGTTESIPLIAASIMSKKIALGADKILIDIKVGEGALIKTTKDAALLSELMKKIGNHYKREVRTLLTPMNAPLGCTIGNRIEVLEAMDVLQGKGESLFTELCIVISAHLVSMGKDISFDDARVLVNESIKNGKAYAKFLEFVNSQGGSVDCLTLSNNTRVYSALIEGKIEAISALKMGELSVILGAGRQNKGEEVDPSVGIRLHKQVGDMVKVGESLFTIYGKENEDLPNIDISTYYTII